MSEHAQPTSRRRAATAGVFVVLALVAVVAPLLLTHHYGALGTPRSDDWSYLRTLFTWQSSGHWDFNHWVSMTLIGQVVASRPIVALFPRSIVALRVFVALLGLGGLGAVVAMARACRVRLGPALLVSLSVAATPMWGALASSYMTDVPAFAGQAAALTLGIHSLRRRESGAWYYYGSLTAGFAAVSIRQYAIVPVLAIVAVHLWHARRSNDARWRRQVATATLVEFVAVLLVFWLWSRIPNSLAFPLGVPNLGSMHVAGEQACNFWRLAGFVALPSVLLRGPVRIVRDARAANAELTNVVAIVGGSVLLLAYLSNPKVPFVGNYFDRRGVLADDILNGQRPLVVPTVVFELLVIATSLAAVLLALRAVPAITGWWVDRRRDDAASLLDRADSSSAVLVATLIGNAVVFAAAVAVGYPIFDRYALAALPLPAILLLRSGGAAVELPATRGARPTLTTLAAIIALVALIGIGSVFTAESASYDAARWRVASAAVAAGYSPLDIDAGYEWVGYLGHRAPPYHLLGTARAHQRKVIASYLKGLCVTVLVDPSTVPPHPIARVQSTGWLRSPVWLYAVRNRRSCQVAPTTAAVTR